MMDTVAGYRDSPGGWICSATRFAIRTMAEAWRSEVQAQTIKVAVVYPGATYFDYENPSAFRPPILFAQLLTAEVVAEATLSALGLPDRVSINSVVLRPTKQES